MKSGMRRLAATLAATTLVGGAALAVAPMTEAWALGTQIGTATVSPAIGTDGDTPTIDTSGPCTDPAGDHSQLIMFGSGFPTDGYTVSANNPNSILPPDPQGGYSVPFLNKLSDIAQMQNPPATYSGTYQIYLVCKHSFGQADYGDFATTMTWSDPNHYTSGTVAAVPTTTTLSASPAGSAAVGASVTLTATVTPAGATGSVQFLDGATVLGTANVASNVATLATTTLSAAAHSLTAKFTPTAPAGATPSTSAALAYTVSVPVPVITKASGITLQAGTKIGCPGGATVPSAVGSAYTCSASAPTITVTEGVRPVALVAPSLSGTGKVGSKLTLKPGLWAPAYSSRTVVWKRDGKIIAKATGPTYVVKKTDKGHHISATMTAHLAGHPDGTASTSAVAARSIAIDSAQVSDFVGTPAASVPATLSVPVGSTIGCVAGTFTGATSTTSGWFLDGAAYPVPSPFVVPGTLAGHQLVCRTVGTNAGGTTTSDAVVDIATATGLKNYVAPRVIGTAKVGKKLVANPGKWNPAKTKATYVWLRNGAAIKGATKPTYVLVAADKKHKISVRVTVTLSGWTAAHAVSAAVSVG